MHPFQEVIACCKVLYHPRASHTSTVTLPRFGNSSTQGRHAQASPEASVGWKGRCVAPTPPPPHLPPHTSPRPPALIHPLLSARKTRIKRRKVNMEKIQGREGTLGEETHYCRNLCRIFFFFPAAAVAHADAGSFV